MYNQIPFSPTVLKTLLEKYGGSMSKYLVLFFSGILLCMTAPGTDALAGTGRDNEDTSSTQNRSAFRDNGESIFIGQDPVTGDRIIRATPRQYPMHQSPEIPYIVPEIVVPQQQYESRGNRPHYPYPYPPYQETFPSHPANRPHYPDFSPPQSPRPGYPVPQQGGRNPAYIYPGMRPHDGLPSPQGQTPPFVYQPGKKTSGPPPASFPARPHRH